MRALDIGCGDGFFSRKLSDLGYSVMGLDISDVALARAKSTVPHGTFLIHDLEQTLPVQDASIDIVWCSEVLEHLFSPLSLLNEIRRILKPGGRALLTVPFHGLIKNLGIALFAFERHYDPTYPHIRFFTLKSLGDLVNKASLSAEATETCGSRLGLLRDFLAPTNILMVARKI